jgi:acrylyl-CoA reductase (NADPH)
VDATQEFDAALPDRARRLVREAREYAATVVAPQADGWERERRWPVAELRRACGEFHAAGIEVPPAHGGLGLPFGARVRVAEELAAADFGFAFALVNHHNATARIAESGTRAAAELFLPRLLQGASIGCTAMSETAAGSDFAAIATTAEATAGGWRLNGAKRWIGNGTGADVFLTFAQTDPSARAKGIACFIVDASTPGFARHDPESLPGIQSAGIGGYRMRDCLVPADHVLYPPGAGFKLAMAGVNKARTHVAAMAAGTIAAALDRSVAFAKERRAFGRALLEHQGLRWTLADVATSLEALRLLTYRAATLIDRGEDAQVAAAMAKKFAGERAPAAISACLQAMGARGLLEEHGLHRRLAAAKAMGLADGTNEMMNERIGAFLGRDA